MNPFFKNINIFIAQKIHFFLRKLSINGTDFPRNSEFFRKIKIKISIFMMHINSEFYYQVKKTFFEKLQFSGKNFRFLEIFNERFAVFFERGYPFLRKGYPFAHRLSLCQEGVPLSEKRIPLLSP